MIGEFHQTFGKLQAHTLHNLIVIASKSKPEQVENESGTRIEGWRTHTIMALHCRDCNQDVLIERKADPIEWIDPIVYYPFMSDLDRQRYKGFEHFLGNTRISNDRRFTANIPRY